jgi:hypothetical protein
LRCDHGCVIGIFQNRREILSAISSRLAISSGFRETLNGFAMSGVNEI